ncbi:hypothetical protein SNEBB_007870 [Seison nebaliae]|nr:hypothetical protein SNEBB_007870 [Seison nebaliae]
MSTWHYICIVVSVGVITWTNVEVKNAYMDEEFHYNQTKEYCNNNFHKWHSKITTFPGLYIIGYLFTKFTSIIFFNQFCKLTVLRYINLIPLFFLYCYTKRILSKRTYFGNDHHIELAAISCITLPILYFYIVFYYTDIWSLLFVLMNYYYFHYESNFPMSYVYNTSSFEQLVESSETFSSCLKSCCYNQTEHLCESRTVFDNCDKECHKTHPVTDFSTKTINEDKMLSSKYVMIIVIVLFIAILIALSIILWRLFFKRREKKTLDIFDIKRNVNFESESNNAFE